MSKKRHSVLIALLFLSSPLWAAFQVPEPVSWEELQILQQDSLLSLQALGLASFCPDTVTTQASNMHAQGILYTNYRWESHQSFGGMCLVLLEPTTGSSGIGSVQTKRFLTPNQAQVLLSASRAIGFEEKGFIAQSNQINRLNAQELQRMTLSGCFLDNTAHNHEEITFHGMPHIRLTEQEVSELLVQDNIYLQDNRSAGVGDSVVDIKPQLANNVFKTAGAVYSQACLDELMNMVSLNDQHSSTNVSFDPRTEITRIDDYPHYLNANIRALVENATQVADLGSGIRVNSFVTLTAAHVVYEVLNNPRVQLFPNYGCVNNQCATNSIASDAIVSIDYAGLLVSNPNPDPVVQTNFDYGAVRLALPVFSVINAELVRDVQLPFDVGSTYARATGYPGEFNGFPAVNRLIESEGPYRGRFDSVSTARVFDMFGSGGQSGGLSRLDNNDIFGVVSASLELASGPAVSIRTFTNPVYNEIQGWLDYNPTAFMDIASPLHGGSYDLLALQQGFQVNAIPFETFGQSAQGTRTIDTDNIEWLLDEETVIAGGDSVDVQTIQQTIPTGEHLITAQIDDGTDFAERTVAITVTGPSGELSAPGYCAINLRSPAGNTCSVPINWSTTDVPADRTPVVINTVNGAEVASGTSGSANVTVGMVPTRLTLHESSEQILTLAETTTQAQLPTGTLSSSLATCAIEPSAGNDDPQGCGVTLYWNNVQYANPYIYYRNAGGNQWFQLGPRITCGQGPCSGNINTDDIVPGLIRNTAGRVFELRQYQCNDTSCNNSGTIGNPVSVNAIRIADDYEYDDTIPHANTLALGDMQTNHSFHKPAPQYDLTDSDIDTYLLERAGTLGPLDRVQIETFNIQNGLQMDLQVQCYGEGNVTPPGGEPADTGLRTFDFRGNVNLQETSGVQPGSLIVSWNAIRRMQWSQNGTQYDVICDSYFVRATRTAGTPGPNLTYSARYDEAVPASSNQPDSYEPDDTVAQATVFTFDSFGESPWQERNFTDDLTDVVRLTGLDQLPTTSPFLVASLFIDFTEDTSNLFALNGAIVANHHGIDVNGDTVFFDQIPPLLPFFGIPFVPADPNSTRAHIPIFFHNRDGLIGETRSGVSELSAYISLSSLFILPQPVFPSPTPGSNYKLKIQVRGCNGYEDCVENVVWPAD